MEKPGIVAGDAGSIPAFYRPYKEYDMKWTTKDNVVWNRWFAWHPVCLCWKRRGGNEYIWLEWLERKTSYKYGGPVYQYRYIQEESE
jgi:hypothetical protein